MGKVIAYAGSKRTIIVLEPDDSLGPFLPLSVITDIGYAVITALTTAQGRAAIAAAARGANSDITEILGMSPVNSASEVLTPQGTANAAVLAVMLGGFVPSAVVLQLTANATLDGTAGVIWANSAGGSFTITVPRSLRSPNSYFGTIMLNGANPVAIVDDLGALKFTLSTTGRAFAIVSVNANAVLVSGVA